MRAPSVCPAPGCPNLAPCPTHTPRRPTGTDRRQARGVTGSGWAERDRNRRTIRRWRGICWWCGRPGATEVDHVRALSKGGLDIEGNRRPIHHACHLEKTARERRPATPGG